MRARVRVPEAYLLVRAYETTRPGLLVMDANGRRVESIALPGMGNPAIDAATIAKRLNAARTASAVERWRFEVAGDAKAIGEFRGQLSSRDGVDVAATMGRELTLRVKPGAATPGNVATEAKRLSLTVRWREPVPVRFAPLAKTDPKGFAAALSATAGTWYSEPEEKRAFITSLFLHPKRLPTGWSSDVEARTYTLAGIPKGGAACRVALAPTKSPGVVALFADVFNEQQVVVGRKGKVDWTAVMKAFADAGCAAKEKR